MRKGPLAGLRVVEVAGVGPGPFCGMFLADLGADVVRVERPGGGMALVEPRLDLLNRGKRSVATDLKTEAGVETALCLAERADVLIEGFRPGVAERLGIGPEECMARQPELVYGRMTGWGQEGPLANTSGHDINYIAPTGALHAIGRAGGPPQIPLNLVGDFGGGAMYLAAGILSALWEAQRSGQGQVVDAAMVDGAAHLMTMSFSMLAGEVWQDERGRNMLDSGAPFYDVYETADHRWMAVGAVEPQFYFELLDILGISDVDSAQYTPENWADTRKRIAEVFRTRTQAEWDEVFAGSDACVTAVLPMSEAPQHPHLRSRNTYVEHDGVVQPAPAPRFSRTPAVLEGAPPKPGEHTSAVLADWNVPPVESTDR